jgi:[protein-PII] uridylyltransferase
MSQTHPTLAAKARVQEARARNASGWEAGKPAEALLASLSREIDKIILSLWPAKRLASVGLLAVGGYGRAELSPYSDIDLLILLPDAQEPTQEQQEAIGEFVTALWDCGLDAGHSVRNLSECAKQARDDLTVATSLLECRRLAGPASCATELRGLWRATIDPEVFAQGKLLEMQQRHHRFQDTPYALEPHVKESPGGLRDLHAVLWIAKGYGIGETWADLARAGMLTRQEAGQLSRQQHYLQTIRAHLHLSTGRREDRLVFDLQGAVAARFGLEAKPGRRVSEVLMQRYYVAAKIVSQVTSLLLANVEAFSQSHQVHQPVASRPLDTEFCETRGLLDIRSDDLFEREPGAILRAFLLMSRHATRRGMTARARRALWNARVRVNKSFREQPENKAAFIALFREPKGVVHALRLMNDLGILGRMLPVFRRIIGQMQHDLFHVYTVDQHILQVIRNLRRLTMDEHAHEFPDLTELMSDFGSPWKLYLAALFHDIAKGRGGDHSQLGAIEVRRFVRQFNIDAETADLLQFLVAEHLTMSTVAQKQDLADPEVISRFATRVGNLERLQALYILTVADIRGTSPKVWNHWKGRLLAALYRQTREVLEAKHGEHGPQAIQQAALATKRAEALRLIQLEGEDPSRARALWSSLPLGYFLRHDASDIAWHAGRIHLQDVSPSVAARLAGGGEAIQVMVYVEDTPALFARLAGYFHTKGLAVLDAQIHTTASGFALDSFMLDARHLEGRQRAMLTLISDDLRRLIDRPGPLPQPQLGKLSRQSRSFPLPTTVQITPDENHQTYTLNLTTVDRPGLLYAIAFQLAQFGVDIANARITTLGERAEDVFLLQGGNLQHDRSQLALERALLATLRTEPLSEATPQTPALHGGGDARA